jgi:tRNA(adenine34) deaminase
LTHRYTALIRQAYLASKDNSTTLFQVLVNAADNIGIETALSILEKCVIQKRLSWLDRALPLFSRTRTPLMDAYRLFYLDYLGLSIPGDGQLVESSSTRLLMRWWNPCPTLDACQQFGLDTRIVCRLAYHLPVQVFLNAVDTRLRFDRNYAALRPYTPYCEEIITLQE